MDMVPPFSSMETSSCIVKPESRDYGVELLDRLAGKIGGDLSSLSVDPAKLRIYFMKSLNDLQNARVQLVSESARLEAQCRLENTKFVSEIVGLSGQLSEASKTFKELDTKINVVSGKIIHLGDQLERRNAPRESLKEARRLILEFSKFLGAGGGTFANISVNSQANETQLIEKTASIRALSALCLELPDDERFLVAKQRVTIASQNLENLLVNWFRHDFSTENDDMMRRIAEVLTYSRSQSGCADVFIDEFLKCLPSDLGDLSMLPDILAQTEAKIIRIFRRPESVIIHLMQALFSQNLKIHFQSKVRLDMPTDVFLTNLFTEYCNFDRLVFQLIERLQLLSDETQLYKLLSGLADEVLQDYQIRETSWLNEHLRGQLSTYYASYNHSKRSLPTSGFSELKSAVQARLHISNDREISTSCLLLSQEVVVNMLDDVRQSAKRCMLLAKPTARPQFGLQILDILVRYLVNEHIDYGITVALQVLNSMDPKIADPSFTFFAAVNESTTLFDLFEKAVNEFIGPLLAGSPSQVQKCLTRRQELRYRLEEKLSTGLEQCLSLALTRIQIILLNQQRKTDFKSDVSAMNSAAVTELPACSLACQDVCKFVHKVIEGARQNLDGQNLCGFLHELGLRFHRLLVDHFYGFSFSDSGGFVAMQDVTAYRDTARECQSAKIDYLFDILLKLMNLMLIRPQNVRQVWQDYEQSGIPRELLANFISLRADYKPRLQSAIKRYLEAPRCKPHPN
ncbi:Exocyst complex component 5 [Echinococcus granulosus]|uniref:Exocyst complex component 5 n=1 Tax=Echinococcus granulosus TaxID=6210 RepID=A0A068WQ01_ECHGR|nr:Exocyst complex component 5 [Echinococcus granulosus]CDS22210.1 exocyst complex component 5 [Echinococcus granulosus]